MADIVTKIGYAMSLRATPSRKHFPIWMQSVLTAIIRRTARQRLKL